MKVKFKNTIVDVSERDCPKYKCFSPHKYIHYSKSIDGQSKDFQDKHFSCSHRNYHGCPDDKIILEKRPVRKGK